jgi:hypothetical protein
MWHCGAVSAAVKPAFLILPMVTFPFVRNPALVILRIIV